MRPRGIVLAIVGVFGCLAAPAGAAVVPTLAGTTIAQSTDAAWTPITLASNVQYDLFDEVARPSATITGNGQVRGFVLRRDGALQVEPGIAAIALPGEQELRFISPTGGSRIEGSHFYVTLPAGTYRLFVLGEGALTLTLTMPGLAGSANVAATVPAALTASLAPRLDDGLLTSDSVYGAGVTLTTFGFVFSGIHTNSAASLSDDVQVCVYEPGENFTSETAFTQGCPGSGEPPPFGPFLRVPPSSGFTSVASADYAAAPGTWGLGGNVNIVGVPPEVTPVVAGLSYGEAGLPPGFTRRASHQREGARSCRRTRSAARLQSCRRTHSRRAR